MQWSKGNIDDLPAMNDYRSCCLGYGDLSSYNSGVHLDIQVWQIEKVAEK